MVSISTYRFFMISNLCFVFFTSRIHHTSTALYGTGQFIHITGSVHGRKTEKKKREEFTSSKNTSTFQLTTTAMYIANTSRTHMRAHAPAHTYHTHTPPSPYRYSMSLCQPTVTARSAGDNSWSLAIETNTGGPVSPRF